MNFELSRFHAAKNNSDSNIVEHKSKFKGGLEFFLNMGKLFRDQYVRVRFKTSTTQV